MGLPAVLSRDHPMAVRIAIAVPAGARRSWAPEVPQDGSTPGSGMDRGRNDLSAFDLGQYRHNELQCH